MLFPNSLNHRRIFVAATFVLGCECCVQQNSIPTFIAINNISLNTKTGEGSNAQKISDAWVYFNGNINGVFPLPTTLPFLDTGSVEVKIFAGIRDNGIKSNPVIYPFYAPYTTKLSAASEKTFVLKPTVTYISSAKFGINDDFENGNSITINRDNNADVRFATINNGFEGKSVQAVLDSKNSTLEKCTSTRTPIPANVNNAYIELNYKTNCILNIGLVASDASYTDVTSVYKIALYPSAEWNKTYINVVDEVRGLNKAYYQIAFKSTKPDTLTTATILIDNLKLIYN